MPRGMQRKHKAFWEEEGRLRKLVRNGLKEGEETGWSFHGGYRILLSLGLVWFKSLGGAKKRECPGF